MDFHFATAFELIADALPDDPRADLWRLHAHLERVRQPRRANPPRVLNGHGLGVDSKVGIYLHNSNEYSEVHHGIFKIRGCPINVNYRYKSDELVYLLDNADAEAVCSSRRTRCGSGRSARSCRK
jgi:fatty-acyl-CoA synthase